MTAIQRTIIKMTLDPQIVWRHEIDEFNELVNYLFMTQCIHEGQAISSEFENKLGVTSEGEINARRLFERILTSLLVGNDSTKGQFTAIDIVLG